MTEELGALRLLVGRQLPGFGDALDAFFRRWRDEALVLDQWFALQAAVPGEQTVNRVTDLMGHDDFDWRLPNRVRALLGTFFNANPAAFHAADGSGYRLFARALARLDGLNPQVAARMAGAAARLPRLASGRREKLRTELVALRDGDCSGNMREVLDRILDADA